MATFKRGNKAVRKRVERKRTVRQMAMKSHLVAAANGERDSIIHVGNIVEKLLMNEDFNEIIHALTAGRIDMELQNNREGTLSAERILGRCEMGSTLWHDLETFVTEKDIMIKPIRERQASESALSEVPDPLHETASPD